MQARQVAGGYRRVADASPRSTPPRSRRSAKLNPEWLDSVARSRPRSPTRCCPIIVAGSEFRDVFGIALTNMLAPGASPAAELKKATAEFKPVLEKTEKA